MEDDKLTFECLIEFLFVYEEDVASYQIGNNADLVFDKDLNMSIRLNWKEGEGVHLWGNIETKTELEQLLKLLTGE